MRKAEEVEAQEERKAEFHSQEAERLRQRIGERPEPGLLEPPYCQVIGRNAVVLLTPEQIAFIVYAMQSYGLAGSYHPIAASIEAEMWRAEAELSISKAKAGVDS